MFSRSFKNRWEGSICVYYVTESRRRLEGWCGNYGGWIVLEWIKIPECSDKINKETTRYMSRLYQTTQQVDCAIICPRTGVNAKNYAVIRMSSSAMVTFRISFATNQTSHFWHWHNTSYICTMLVRITAYYCYAWSARLIKLLSVLEHSTRLAKLA